MQVESPEAEGPLSGMSIGALEVCAPSLAGRGNVPAAAAFVSDEWEVQGVMGLTDEGGVGSDGVQAVRARY